MLAISRSAWLCALALFFATFVPSAGHFLLIVLFQRSVWLLFAASLLAMLLANRALAANKENGLGVLTFYRDKPIWALLVQLALFALWAFLAVSGPSIRAHNGVCFEVVGGERVQLPAQVCHALLLRMLRFFIASWLILAWLGLAQFALAGKRKPARAKQPK